MTLNFITSEPWLDIKENVCDNIYNIASIHISPYTVLEVYAYDLNDMLYREAISEAHGNALTF
jgi:hypothetical protein